MERVDVPEFSTPRGTQDILPEEWPYWNFVLDHAFDVAGLFGYRRIETPAFAEVSLFSRTSGEGTDVVDKEMYVFRDREGRELALRPEGTAPVMRAYLQHGMHKLPQPVKVSYVERMYRYDRPQRGRYREHRQFGCEAIGSDDAYVDVEMISLLDTFYRRIGLENLTLRVNTIGDPVCRPAYLEELVGYLREHEEELAEIDRERIGKNPLRVLDSKETRSQRVIEGAPHMLDHLCVECRAHWQRLLHGLGVIGLDYAIDHRLVRGLDYYTRTVFEFQPPGAEGAQSVVGGGGRYDGLAEALGAPHFPGIGFGSGVERLVLNVKSLGVEVPPEKPLAVFVAHMGSGAEDEALRLVTRLRRHGTAADIVFGQRTLKAQMKRADSSDATWAAILGEEEVQEGAVTLRRLAGHEQRRVPLDEAEVVVRTETTWPER
jgi:histidyl-tRNA synthetase